MKVSHVVSDVVPDHSGLLYNFVLVLYKLCYMGACAFPGQV